MKKILYFAAACAALVACSKQVSEQSVAFEKGQEVTLSIAAPDRTKMSSELSGTDIDFKWEQDDAIKVTVGGSSATFTVSQLYNGGLSASFKGVMPAGGETFDVQFPVEDPAIATQSYSSSEALSHNAMKFTATGCSLTNPTLQVTAANAALRLNLYGTGMTISKIVVKDASSNSYTLNIDPAVTLPETEAAAQAFFVVVPTGSYKFSAELYDNAATPAMICKFEPASAQTFAANQVLSMPAKEVKKGLPDGALPGKFSVSDTKQVHFSKGNLYYDGSYLNLKFESNQYSPSSKSSSHLSYFLSAPKSSYLSTDIDRATDPYSSFSFGSSSVIFTNDAATTPRSNFSANGQAGVWRTLSGGNNGEWNYLLNSRTGVTIGSTTNARFACVKVNNILGMLLFPDEFSWPEEVTSIPTTFNSASSTWNDVNYSTTDFEKLESADCVFLPAAGYTWQGSLYDPENYGGRYWASTAPSSYGKYDTHCLAFTETSIYPATEDHCHNGQLIRLVTDAQ